MSICEKTSFFIVIHAYSNIFVGALTHRRYPNRPAALATRFFRKTASISALTKDKQCRCDDTPVLSSFH